MQQVELTSLRGVDAYGSGLLLALTMNSLAAGQATQIETEAEDYAVYSVVLGCGTREFGPRRHES